MDNPILGSPESRFNAALSLATSEFQANIDGGGYEMIPNPYYPEIYASAYFDLVDNVVDAVRMSDNGDELFGQIIQHSKKQSDRVNEELVESGKISLANEVDGLPDQMPDEDEYDKIKRMWENN